ncbi:MAG TPA: DUF2784 domain-containing protein [Burkholderiaceae bacterium]|nr:DUF2784 domain-containing protein [Burkholderiaceae bacterium]
MSARLAADALVLLHLAFVAFALLGGLLVVWRAWTALLHLPAAGWAVWIEASGGICPLTPWENRLRQAAGQSGYEGGFVEHYLIPVLYPAGLTPTLQTWLAIVVLVVNLAIYTVAIALALRRPRRRDGSS